MDPNELSVIGVAILALAVVSRGLMDLLRGKSENAEHALISSTLLRMEDCLNRIETMHSDPNSTFSTVESEKILHRLETAMALLGQGRG